MNKKTTPSSFWWTLAGMWKSFTTRTRAVWNLGTKAALLWEAAIIGKNIGIAPDISTTIVDIADKLPNILDISTDIPWMGDFVETIISSNPALQNIASDIHNAANLSVYWWAFALLYFLSRIWFWEKWRFEAGTSAFVWTALSVGLFKEMIDVMSWYGHDIMSWLPLRAFEAMPESVRDMMIDADSRRNIYAGASGALWFWTWIMAAKNLKRLIMWIPKKKEKPND